MVKQPTNDEDIFIDEDVDDVSHEKHKQLLQTITSTTKRKIQPSTRNEPSLQVSEFHLSTGQQTTNVNELADALKKKAPHIRQKVQVSKSTKNRLQKPLDKIHAEKIKRAVAYDNFKKHISRWSAVIENNKAADQLKFPLISKEIEVFDNRIVDLTRGFGQPTDLQKKITNILQSSEIVKQKQKDLKMSWIEKEKEKYPLTLKELLEKRKTMAKFRAQESYRHSKAHRQNKIKSKQYHRLLRKNRTKEQIKEFEKLQETDPVAALEKLNAIEKTRAEERASLRHKSTGQWARNHVVRAKYDKNSRIALSEQLRKGKELTQKVGLSLNETDSDNSDDEKIEVSEQIVDPDNPWLAERKEFTDYMAGYKNFVANNCDDTDKNVQKEKSKLTSQDDYENTKLDDNNIDVLNDDKIVKPVDNKIKKKKKEKNVQRNKVKLITVNDLSEFSDEESFVEVLKIVDTPEKKVNFSDDTIKTQNKINKTNENSKTSSNTLCNKKIKNTEIIHTVAGTWFVSPDNINNDSLKTKKVHKDVANAFKNVEAELKNKIKTKLENINKAEVKQSSTKIKHKCQDANTEYLKINNKRLKTEIIEPLFEDSKTSNKNNSNLIESNRGLNIKTIEKSKKQAQNIDPTEFLQVAQTSLETEEMDQVEDRLDDKETTIQEQLIAEAFADDDIINEFKEEKKKLEEQSKPERKVAIPGWGSWAGPHIKKRKFRKKGNTGMFRTPAKPPRKDFKCEKVIIHENADNAIKPHLVSELPYPFKDVEEYEETIQTAVGRTWVPETVFHKLTAPPVVTKMGQIISPIDENHVVNLKLND